MQNRKKPAGNVFGSNARHQEKKHIAMGIMVEEAMKGDMEALRDLLSILTPSEDSQGLLTKIFTSPYATEQQRDLISWQASLFSDSFNKENAIDLAKSGNIEAFKYLLKLLDSESASWLTSGYKLDLTENYPGENQLIFDPHVEIIKEEAKPMRGTQEEDIWVDEKIAMLLFDILFSGHATSEQKGLIKDHKDTIVLVRNYFIVEVGNSRDPNYDDIDWNTVPSGWSLNVNFPPESKRLVVKQQKRYSLYDCVRLGLSPKRLW